MRVAIVSDIHGNLTAFDAILADLREIAPDLILHGGDLADSGSAPVEIVDRIRDLGWPGVLGNTDELLLAPRPIPNFPIVEEQAAWTRATLGADRLNWLGTLPLVYPGDDFGLVHASPATAWRAPLLEAADPEFEVYTPLGRLIVIYAHIHRPFVRRVSNLLVANTGSVSLSHDGDPRASYLLLENSEPQVRRVDYDLERERKALRESTLPRADWIADMITKASFRMP